MDVRKDLYIDNSTISNYQGNSLLSDIYIEHNSLPELKLEDIDTSTEFMGRKIGFPLIISAMIGGTHRSLELNEMLVNLAKEFNIPLEVGSQEEVLHSEEQSKLFVSLQEDEDEDRIFLLSNLSVKASKEDVDKAMGHIKANAVSLSINFAQETVSFDGNKDFTNALNNIGNLANEFGDKLLVKEKTLGMSKETVRKLADAGVKYVDVSGFGGSNIIELENLRNYRNDFSDLYEWGIPTAKSILNAREASEDIRIIASGGIRTSMDIVKALIIGADYVAIAGEILKYLIHGGYEQARQYVEEIIYKTKIVMMFLGVDNIEDLKKVDFKITGKLKEIL